MRDYQRIKNNKYILPRDVYHQTLWIIRGYDRMKEDAAAIMVESPPPPDGQPRGANTGDDTASKAARRETNLRRIKQIDAALEDIPPEYRRGVWNNTVHCDPFPIDAARSTYALWKSRFVYKCAINLGII